MPMDILEKVLVSLATTLCVALLTLSFGSVRSFLFYKRVEYDLEAVRQSGQDPFSCSWDVHWEDYGLHIEIADISNDNLRGVSFRKLSKQEEHIDKMFPSDSFTPLFNGEIFVKVNSIVRRDWVESRMLYVLRLVFRRKRF